MNETDKIEAIKMRIAGEKLKVIETGRFFVDEDLHRKFNRLSKWAEDFRRLFGE